MVNLDFKKEEKKKKGERDVLICSSWKIVLLWNQRVMSKHGPRKLACYFLEKEGLTNDQQDHCKVIVSRLGLPGVFLTLLFLFITWHWSISGECKTFVLMRAWSSLLWNAVFPFSDLNWIFKILTDLSVNCWMNLGTKGKGKAVADADLTTKEINQVLATSCNIFVKQETGYQRTRAVWNSSLLKSPGTDIKVPGCIHCLNILHEKQKKKKS